MSRTRKLVILFATIGMVVSAAGMTAILQRAALEIVPPCEETLWSLTEGPYEYISDGTLKALEPIYVFDTYEAIGQVQYKGLAIICFMGIPQKPVDESGREAWCIAWAFDRKTGLWEPGKPYLWGTTGQYLDWREETGLDEIGP